ncbi:MAG: dihydrodipicolinate reductase C-terminal domain-containing protein [Candidatus Micrarchaeota archaeon]
MPVRLCFSGLGKMGREVFNLASKSEGFTVASALDPAAPRGEGVPCFASPAEAFAAADVVIDFSVAEACARNAVLAAGMGKRLVIGTTGLQPADLEAIRAALAEGGGSGVISANYSVGVNVFIQAAKLLAAKLPGCDLALVESHHRQKRDAPSGTALRILAAIGRTPADVPVFSLRLGDLPGEHALIFAGNAERVELWHKATSRACFASGALAAAGWVASRGDGVLHDFVDVLE